MDKDVARLITQLRGEIEALETGKDPVRIGIKQAHAGALYAIWMALSHGYPEVARSRAKADPARERAIGDATLRAIADETDAPVGDWAADFYFGSALLLVAAAIHGTLKHRCLPLYGEGFCRSRERLEEQACRDGLISEADGRLLAAIRNDAAGYKHDQREAEYRPMTSLNDLVVGLGAVVGVAAGFAGSPRAGQAQG